ncbi:type II toxin-antitoxin system RelE/ParE family toxin [Ramlibacter albus]|uniref:Type II toxin-antitoxin system RelE/ParE family toxin n=1 Tax=Ramlibacter albus TaxID=2079448 RepID=A0A923MC77_9BURK|nr:type II toxin-antitoxin system RelE/ParE family toxin [Ramlibacter albus]
MRISLSADAQRELEEGAVFYARHANRLIADAFISEFDRSAKLLIEYPELGSIWRRKTRRLPLRRFPYSIVYFVRETEVRVVAVAHHRRRPGFWRGRS